MKYQYFTLYDNQTATFGVPFFCSNDIEAKRVLTMQIKSDKTGGLRQFADIYDLYKLAEITDDCLKAHVVTADEFELNGNNFVYKPDIDIKDVAPTQIVIPDVRKICSVRDVVQMLDMTSEAANNG